MGEHKRDKENTKGHPIWNSGIINPRIYTGYIQPAGCLTMAIACHALFHYAITALEVYKSEKDSIKYEGDRNQINLHQLYTTTAKIYGVKPDDMGRFWEPVDMQFIVCGITQLPREGRWRDPKPGLITDI